MVGKSKLRAEVDALGDLSRLSTAQLKTWRKKLSDRITQIFRHDNHDVDEYNAIQQKYDEVRVLLTQRARTEHASASSSVSGALGQIVSLATRAQDGVAQMDDAAAELAADVIAHPADMVPVAADEGGANPQDHQEEEEDRAAAETAAAKADADLFASELAEIAAEEERIAIEKKAEDERMSAEADAEEEEAEDKHMSIITAEVEDDQAVEEDPAQPVEAGSDDSDSSSSSVQDVAVARPKKSHCSDHDDDLDLQLKGMNVEFAMGIERANKKQRVETPVDDKPLCDVDVHIKNVKWNRNTNNVSALVDMYKDSSALMHRLAETHKQATNDIDIFNKELLADGRNNIRKMRELAQIMDMLTEKLECKRYAAIGAEI